MSIVATELPKGLIEREKDYFYNPRNDAVKAGIVKRKCFNKRWKHAAVIYANSQNVLIEHWRKSLILNKTIDSTSTFEDVVNVYYISPDFTTLAKSTKEDYKTYLKNAGTTVLKGKWLMKTAIGAITAPDANMIYEKMFYVHGVHYANQFISILRLVFNYAIRRGFIQHNPFAYVRKKPIKRRKVMWSRKDVLAFLNTAFAKWEHRNVGILFYMIYEWGQRPGDICNLRWENIDMKERKVTIGQSKRGAVVHLPISDGLYSILQQQRKDFPSPLYVAPYMRRVNAAWKPYSVMRLSECFRDIKKEAKLADELQLRDLRRTAITETIENGGDVLTVMMLSGHTSASSLTPYFVHTLRGATRAQQIRDFPASLYAPPLKKVGYDDILAKKSVHA